MQHLLRISLAATIVAVLAPQVVAQRGHDTGGRSPAPVRTPSPAPAPAPVRTPSPAPAPIQRSEPPPTRTYNPPANPTPPAVRDTPRYSPPVQRDTPRYSPPVQRETPRYSPPVQNDTPRYSPPVQRDTPRYSPPVQRDTPRYQPPAADDSWARRGSGSDRVTTPVPGGGGPVRVNLPGDRTSGGSDSAPPAVGSPVRGRTSSGLHTAPVPSINDDAPRTASPTLRDLYRRVGSDASPAAGTRRGADLGSDVERARVQPVLRDTLAGRYKERLGRDLETVRPKPDVGVSPGAPIKVDTGSRPPVRISNPVAEHRYPTPGRETTKPVTPVKTPHPRDPGATTPIALEPKQRPPTTVTTGPVGNLTRRTGPQLGPTHRGNSAVVRNPNRYYSGASHWSGHRASLGFAFGHCRPFYNWGFYSYPFYYSCWYPRWSWYSSWSFGWGWSCYTPSYVSCWWYPQRVNCYQPIAWDAYDCEDWWDRPYSYDVWYSSYPRSTVIVHEVESEAPPATEVVGTEPARKVVAHEEEVTPAKLAEKHVALGDFYFKEGRFQEASESYLRALAYAPEDATIHFVLADALFATGDYHYAAFIIGKAMKLDADLARSTADKRSFYKSAKAFDDQVATLRGYLKDKPYDAAAWLVLGYNLKFSGDADGAKAAFERVVEVDPGNEAAKLFLAALTRPATASQPASRG